MTTRRVMLAMVMLVATACSSGHAHQAPTAASVTSTTQRHVLEPTRELDLGGARVRIPVDWHVSKYQGELATVIFPLFYLSDRPLVGPCLSEHRSLEECTVNYWFPPGATTPDDGLLTLWQEWEFPGSYDRLSTVPGHVTTIDRRRAKRYSGPVVDGGCPTDSATQISAAVHSSTGDLNNGAAYYVVVCLGPHVSATDRHAVQAMISSLRITN